MSKKRKPTEAVRIKTAIVNRLRKIAEQSDTTIRSVVEKCITAALPK